MTMRKIRTRITAILLAAMMAITIIPETIRMRNVYAAGTSSDLVRIAASQVGYHEKASNYNLDDFLANSGSANYNKYARDVGVANGNAWCATFVWWCMKSAGVADSAYPSRTTVTRDWFNQRGLYRARGTYIPKPGDYVIFGNVAHCGIVEYVSGNYVHTIEGNSKDAVKRNTYSLSSSYILGYGIINYSETSSVPTVSDTSNPGSPYPIPAGIYRSGNRGDAVKWIQKFANDVMGLRISIDGIYGNQTITAVKQFQQQNGLAVDGIAGSQTISTMLAVWKNKVTASKPVDLGNEFAAIILRSDIWKPIMNAGNNVVLWDEKANAQYYWLFKKQSDGSYIIQSLYDGKCLDVYGAKKDDYTNVWPFPISSGDNAAQRWFIYESGNSYKIVSKLSSNMCLDVYGAATTNGANINIYHNNDSIAQRFSIYKISHSALQSIRIASGYSANMYPGESQTLKFNLSPDTTKCNMVKWSSSDASVLAVDGNGKITAKKAGSATIHCISTFDSNIQISVKITVKEKEVPTTEATTEIPTTEATTEMPTTEATTEMPTTEATTEMPTTEATTEISTTEATTEVATTEAATEVPATEDIHKLETEADEPVLVEDGADETKETQEPQIVSIGKVLYDSKKKCKVVVTCNDAECATVEYLKSTNKKGNNIKIPARVYIDGVTYTVTGIAEDAFYNKKKLTSVSIPNTITYIGDSAFEGCKKLKSIIIPGSVERIGRNAFKGCKSLKKITFKCTNLSDIGKNAFKNINKRSNIKIPKGKKKEYKKLLKKAGCKL